MVTPTSIKALFPEFGSLNDAYIQLHINSAALYVNHSVLLSVKDHAQSYLTAHFLKISQDSKAGSSNIKKEKVGDLTREYQSLSVNSGQGINSTVYGQEYLRSINTTSANGPIII